MLTIARTKLYAYISYVHNARVSIVNIPDIHYTTELKITLELDGD